MIKLGIFPTKFGSMKPEILWTPPTTFTEQSNLAHYKKWLADQSGHSFDSYEAMHQWSVEDIGAFWRSLWDYYSVIDHGQATTTLKLPEQGMIGCEWFPGSRLNYTEHIFRKAQPDHPAIVFQSELHPLQQISWDELRENVASLAAFLKQNGVGKGDRIVGFLPNIPEAIMAFLAVNSLGAIWSSCSPISDLPASSNAFNRLNPK